MIKVKIKNDQRQKERFIIGLTNPFREFCCWWYFLDGVLFESFRMGVAHHVAAPGVEAKSYSETYLNDKAKNKQRFEIFLITITFDFYFLMHARHPLSISTSFTSLF